LVLAWSITYLLLRPGITWHQPYASRRLVPTVLPGLILLAVWLAAWLGRKSRVIHLVNVPDFLKQSPRAFVIACCAGAIFLPPMIGNFGLSLTGSDGLALQRAYVGEIAAINKICQAIPADASVLIADYTMNQQFAEDIRGTCNVPVAGIGSTKYPGVQVVPPNAGTVSGAGSTPQAVLAAVRAIEKAGRHPIVLAPTSAPLSQLGNGAVNLVMDQNSSIDEHVLFGTPRNTLPQTFTAYSWEPAK
jgi:hypothetical protein